jgi:hypothetical protein
MNRPLIDGGQGRTADEVYDTAECWWLFFGVSLTAAMFGLLLVAATHVYAAFT